MPGVDVYRRDQIPSAFNFTRSPYIHEIVLQARPGVWINPSKSLKQVPLSDLQVYRGGHGYPPHHTDMKGIFFAKGPDFRKGTVIGPVDMVDVYQVLTWVLRIPALPHNGTWAHVEPALVR
ncbi:glycerophosphocholine cholinephosphodiesterase ENPP6-like [Oratosquilla oratoria]|uniref:glycerophosphocholine cholinephosphodiesterase ENPP6-like n=1 Tax=Oratosquilla oratoria TaxID=337810 RepID=UPI003F767780